MDKPLHGLLHATELYQVGLVVRDLDRSVERYGKTLGIAGWEYLALDDTMFSEATYRGKPARHRFRVAFGMVGPMQIELIEPIEGDTTYRDFLRERGEGVHHLGHIRVPDLGQAIQELEREGFACVQAGRLHEGGGYAYIDSVQSLGVMTELLEIPDGPPPGYPDRLWRFWLR